MTVSKWRWIAALTILISLATRAPRARAAGEVRVAVNPNFASLIPGENAAETFELNALGMTRIKIVNLNSFTIGSLPDQWEPVIGKYRKKLSHEDFVHLVGRDDLVRSYRRRRTAGIIMLVVGGAAALGGSYEILHATHPSGLSYGLAGGGALLVGLGFAGISGQSMMTASEALEACVRYDDALRAYLGLPREDYDPTQDHGPEPHAQTPALGRRLLSGLRAAAIPGGGALGLALSF